MKPEQIKKRLEEIMFNQNIDNPYINIDVAVQWIVDNFTPKAKPKIDWIEEWSALFPKDVLSNGTVVYSKPKDCLNKMQNFVKENPTYTKELIFAATKYYLRDRYRNNWEYTRTASNFIHHREKGSLLAGWCEKLLNAKEKKEEQTSKNTFFV